MAWFIQKLGNMYDLVYVGGVPGMEEGQAEKAVAELAKLQARLAALADLCQQKQALLDAANRRIGELEAALEEAC